MLCDSGKHARADLIRIMERKSEIKIAFTLQNPVLTLALPLQRPTDLQKRPIERARLAGTPSAHAATVNTFSSSGATSP
jgi:hypothetical protein